MTLETLEQILKVAGSALSGIGSILLAWRLRSLVQWIVGCVVAHEMAVTQLSRIVSGQQQTGPIVTGLPHHLLNFQNTLGVYLLIAGFASLGIGMLCNLAALLF